ncbi:hypothetical protein OTU49_005441 [Cherax quadricarinatus]|uniref:Chitin-binding type-2 domain-containing protein n=1 Tax=Cherax quadricarinatus TaxID=27406 RepID=A0AAW0WX59_CHEQU|nr:uncharacterized protein LOC128696481 [Cherax quadricarinatus]
MGKTLLMLLMTVLVSLPPTQAQRQSSSSTQTPATGPEDCPEEVSRGCFLLLAPFLTRADPNDCSKYCQCTGNDSGIIVPCPANMYYNDILNICSFPSWVNCGIRPKPS